jgi:hypothetical protein
VLELKSLGEIAGIGGGALGVVALLVRPVDRHDYWTAQRRPRWAVKLIAIGCFMIGPLGVAAGIIGSRSNDR